MIAHVVLFEPRRDLSPAERDRLAVSFEQAMTTIPQVRRARVGLRRRLGRLYDRANDRDFRFIAIIEFETEADLRAYLDHPAHDDLGRQFYETAAAALAYDFELSEGESVKRVFEA